MIAAGQHGVLYVGLNYQSIYGLPDYLAMSLDEQKEVFAEIQIMEQAALSVYNKKGK